MKLPRINFPVFRFRLWMLPVFPVAIVSLFLFMNDVQIEQKTYDKLIMELKNKENKVQALKAELSYLNQPENLKKLNQSFLKMQTINPNQMIAIDDIPMRSRQNSLDKKPLDKKPLDKNPLGQTSTNMVP